MRMFKNGANCLLWKGSHYFLGMGGGALFFFLFLFLAVGPGRCLKVLQCWVSQMHLKHNLANSAQGSSTKEQSHNQGQAIGTSPQGTKISKAQKLCQSAGGKVGRRKNGAHFILLALRAQIASYGSEYSCIYRSKYQVQIRDLARNIYTGGR